MVKAVMFMLPRSTARRPIRRRERACSIPVCHWILYRSSSPIVSTTRLAGCRLFRQLQIWSEKIQFEFASYPGDVPATWAMTLVSMHWIVRFGVTIIS